MMQDDQQSSSLYVLKNTTQATSSSSSLDEAAIIDKVDSILYQAIERNASDIHLQPNEHQLIARYRIDGILYNHEVIEHDQQAIISRLKVLAKLDIAQRRIPQDGKIKIKLTDPEEKIIDIRVATFPSIHGEKMVLRILDRAYSLRSLQSIGLSDQMHTQITKLMAYPHGFFLVTGPTGSGKSTTLYAMLSALNTSEKNIITMEDPVEYEIAGVTQGNVNTGAGFVFQTGLRALLRQDPDIIMIGEIRDKETVTIAIESSLTGHMVLSTLHTNDAPGAITRLLDMGVEPFLINASLTGILAQRLARMLCQHCKEEQAPTPAQQQILKRFNLTITTSFVARGCSQCHHLGYKGRIGIFELLIVSQALSTLITHNPSPAAIAQQALQDGMVTLLHDGIIKAESGIIALDELFSLILVDTNNA